MCHLARDVEPPAQPLEVFLVRHVPVRQTASHRAQQPARKQADEELQQVVPLSVQGRQLPIGHAQLPGDREHADEGRAHCAFLAVDLGQDLQSRPWGA